MLITIDHGWNQGMAPSTFYNVVAIYELMKFLSFKRVGVVYGYRHRVWCDIAWRFRGWIELCNLSMLFSTKCHTHQFQQSLNTQTCLHHARMMVPYQFHTLILWLPLTGTVSRVLLSPSVADCRICQGHQSRSEGSLFGPFGSGTAGRISDSRAAWSNGSRQ